MKTRQQKKVYYWILHIFKTISIMGIVGSIYLYFIYNCFFPTIVGTVFFLSMFELMVELLYELENKND